ncbi:MAG: hypothetical protein NC096_00855, partial [Candidatus Amulumruptor caecigallinarius]|nr:hypothetical protein [Candidatus Amulumruptor caecigallinarius]
MHSNQDILLIVPTNLKNKLIFDLSNKLHNIKITTFNDIKNELYFSYDEKAIHFLMKEYNFKFDNAKIIIDNLYYVEDKSYNIEKLDNLVKIKNELISNNLLIYNDLYKSYLKSKSIKIYGYTKLNHYEMHIVEDLKQITDVEILKNNKKEFVIDKCYEFENMLDEISFIAEKISNLISNNVDINDIAILNVEDEYTEILSLVFKLYNIPIEENKDNYLYGTNTCKMFLKTLKEKGLQEALNSIKASKLYDKFLKICNKYSWCEDI